MTSAARGFPHHIPSEELHWLAGLLEGEGSFLTGPPSAPRQPVLAVQLTDEDVVARVAAMFGRKPGCWQPREARWQTTLRALQMLSRGHSVREVAAAFGTSVWCIYDLRGGRTHKHLSR